MLAYVDDLVFIVEDRKTDALKHKTEEVFRRVDTWMSTNKLKLPPEKTEAIIFLGGDM